VLEAAVELMGYGLRTADIAVTLDLDPKLPELSADADQLAQVFTNLLANAQQALLEVAPPRRLMIASRWVQSAGTVHITFTDNGPGIPAAVRSRIFEPFYTSKPVGVGTGIGLSFSYGVIVAHGGRIALESPPTGGAHFIITLPLAPTAPAPAGQPQNTRHPSRSRDGRLPNTAFAEGLLQRRVRLYSSRGQRVVNTAPRPNTDRTSMAPPWASTMRLARANPNPAPST
jgi:hypothetical protein